MRLLLAAVWIVAGLLPGAWGQAPTKAPGPLEGTWEIISLIDNGQLVDADRKSVV